MAVRRPPRPARSARMKLVLCVVVLLAVASAGRAALHTETVTYKHGDVTLEGYLAYDDSVLSKTPVGDMKRPGVLVVHEWLGPNAYSKKRAEMLAQIGYVAFA